MARKAIDTTPASASRSSSKRAAPDKPTPTRQSKRARATPAKTSYVETFTDEDEDPKASDYEEEESKDRSSESEPDEASSEEEVKSKKATPRGRAAKRTSLPMHSKPADEKELWKPNAKLTPGTQLIIKKPKAREAGNVAYSDETIHPNTMLFLKDLAANNDRGWLKCTFYLCNQFDRA